MEEIIIGPNYENCKGIPRTVDPNLFYRQLEQWYILPNIVYNFAPGYYISTWGRIYNSKTGRYLPQTLAKKENNHVRLALTLIDGSSVNVAMHVLMLTTFRYMEDYQTKVPNHIDGVKWHNELYNLEWLTWSENVIHAHETGLINEAVGERNGYAALTDEQYDRICQLLSLGYFPAQINKIMNIEKDITNIAQKIKMGVTGISFSEKYDMSYMSHNHYKKFSDEEVHKICQLFQDKTTLTPKEILAYLGYDVENMSFEILKKYRDTISTIKRRVSYTRISDQYDF